MWPGRSRAGEPALPLAHSYQVNLGCWRIVGRPPVIVSCRLDGGDERWLALQRGTAVELERIQLVQVAGTRVDQRRVGEGPQALGRLQLRRVGRQGHQVQV